MIDDLVKNYLLEKDKKTRLEHISSGLLSASRLGKTTLENVLYLIGVEGVPVDEYALGVFARGNQAEDWIVSTLNEIGVVESLQTELLYTTPNGSKIIGYRDLKLKDEDISTEVKSIKNSAFKYLDKEGAKLDHRLQACTYALADGHKQFRVLYLAADDLRRKEFVYDTKDYENIVNTIADKTYKFLNEGTLPVFTPITPFQKLELYKSYTQYPDWFGEYDLIDSVNEYQNRNGEWVTKNVKKMGLVKPYGTNTLMAKLKAEYPESYEKLKSWKEKHNVR